MTADGTLYVDEECRDCFEEELDKWFGKENWGLDGSPFGDYWDMADFPLTIEVDVLDNDRETIIGKVEITSENFIEDMGGGKFIACEPKSIKLLWIKDELQEMIKEKLNRIVEAKN